MSGLSSHSVVDYRAEHEGYRCGYCHSPNTNYSHGMWAYQLSVEHYQDLIDRGWRRSGKYLYKPTMSETCCPMYPIRCDVANFRLSTSQKKVIKRVNRYLNYDQRPPTKDEDDAARSHQAVPIAAPSSNVESDGIDTDVLLAADVEQLDGHSAAAKQSGDSIKRHPKPGTGPDPNKPPAKKAKQIRLEKKQAKVGKVEGNRLVEQTKGKSRQEMKTLEDYLNDVIEKPAHQLELRLLRSSPRSEEFDTHFSDCHRVYHKYQTTIHHDPPTKPSEKQFVRFLIDSPLIQTPSLETRAERLPLGFGSFHQQYVLDGKIIAVGVIDILPNCVSSVYLFYDPDYAFLTLGTYSALRELAFTRSLHQVDAEIQFYYLGFYIHTCPKMVYKAQYVPSYLCCPETYQWFPTEHCLAKLDANKYCRFAEDGVADEDLVSDSDIRRIPCLHKGALTRYSACRRSSNGEGNGEVEQYAKLVGAKCAKQILLCR